MKKKGIVWGVVAAVILVLVWVIVTGVGIGNEVGALDAVLKGIHEPDGVQQALAKLKPMGVDLKQTSASAMEGDGPRHSLLIYAGWAHVKLDTDPTDASYRGYHISYVAKWF